MPDTQRQHITGAKATAALKQAGLANSVLKLFKDGFVPSVTSPVADFDANECDFDDYAPIVILAWNNPTLGSISGYNLDAPLQRFVCLADQVTMNMVGGWWLEDAAGAVLDFGTFDPSRPMQYGDQAIEIVPLEFFPAG